MGPWFSVLVIAFCDQRIIPLHVLSAFGGGGSLLAKGTRRNSYKLCVNNYQNFTASETIDLQVTGIGDDERGSFTVSVSIAQTQSSPATETSSPTYASRVPILQCWSVMNTDSSSEFIKFGIGIQEKTEAIIKLADLITEFGTSV